MQVRVRFAPSPTGIPHIGNTRTALFNFLLAKKNSGTFILRIEDTDQKRIVKGAVEKIEEILKWLEIEADEKFIQSKRLDIYKEKAEELIKYGVAEKEEGAVRFMVPKDKTLEWTDAVGNKKITFASQDVENFVLLKSDGFPTYHLANVVDDYLMKITHVIRGEEWISSTPKHLLIYEAFGWTPPTFVHLPVILGPDRSKLSKRHGAKSVLELRSEGYLKEAILNFMALLGWNPGKDQEIMSLDEMVSLFKLADINTANPVFDIKKLDWMNGVYIRKSQIPGLRSQILKISPEFKNINSEILDKFIALSQTRMNRLLDFKLLAGPILLGDNKTGLGESPIVKDLISEFKKVRDWNQSETFEVLKAVMLRHKVKMPTFYKIFTGSESGLPLPQSLEILGKEKTLERLQ